MAKRKTTNDDASDSDASSSGSSAPSLIDVDFDFFPANPPVDLIALKRLLRQLLYTDADELDLHPLAELLLDESLANGVGSTIKVDGEESDPFSFLGVLNLNLHQANPHVAPLLAYLRARASPSAPLSSLLASLSPSPSSSSSPSDGAPQVGLVISERLINMPVQTQPPLWRMLGAELVAAAERDPSAYRFTHLLLLSKLYLPPDFPKAGGAAGRKKAKAKAGGASGGKKQSAGESEAMDVDSADLRDGLLPFHPEDSLLARFASTSLTYPFTRAPPRDAADPLEFGLDQRGGLMLFDFSAGGDRWDELVRVLEEGCV